MPSVVRKGDTASSHGSFPSTAVKSGSSNVFINGLPCSRKGDSCDSHSDGYSTHSRSVSGGSSTVFVNGVPIARVGDAVSCGGTLSNGSPNVNAN